MRLVRAISTIGVVRWVLLLAIVIGVAGWFLLHRPGWWTGAGDRSPRAVAVGTGLEQAITREVTKVREPGPWGFVLVEDEINAWLVNRLEPWLESRGDVILPADVSDPRIRFGDGWVEVGLLTHQVGFPIFASARFEVRLDGGTLTLVPLEARMGPKTFDRQALAFLADYALLDDRSELDPSGELRVPAVIDLVDGRRVVLEELEVAPGELGLRFRTPGP